MNETLSIPVPVYYIGQKVFAAVGHLTEKSVQCPDCLGSRVCKVTTASGETYEAACDLCSYGFMSRGAIKEPATYADARELTIGSVRINTGDERVVSYMCVETGVGSGTIWYEDSLFNSYDDALVAAKAKSQEVFAKRSKELAAYAEQERKKHKRKPSWDKRRIRELETEVEKLTKQLDASQGVTQ